MDESDSRPGLPPEVSRQTRSLLTRLLLPGALTTLATVAVVLVAHHQHRTVYGGRPGDTPPGVEYSHPAELSLQDLPKPILSFAVLGDWGKPSLALERTTSGLHVIQRKLAAREASLDAVLLTGDNFYPAGVEGLTDPAWEELWGAHLRDLSVPCYAVLGNHDYRDHRGADENLNLATAKNEVRQYGEPGFENWRIFDDNGPLTPGAWYSRWISKEGIAVQLVALDTNAFVGKTKPLLAQGEAELDWLADRLHDVPPQDIPAPSAVVRIVMGHHPVTPFGDKPRDVSRINAADSPHDPRGRTLAQILAEEADLYLCGHAHTVSFSNLDGTPAKPASGPVHGVVKALPKPTPLQLVSGTASEVHATSRWDDSSHYSARIAGFTLVGIGPIHDERLGLQVQFIDCREAHPHIIYALEVPLAVHPVDRAT